VAAWAHHRCERRAVEFTQAATREVHPKVPPEGIYLERRHLLTPEGVSFVRHLQHIPLPDGHHGQGRTLGRIQFQA